MFRCMSSTNCHSLLDVVLASNSLCKACSSLCTTSNNHLQPSFAEARNRSWNAVLTARDGKNQSELKAANILPIKPCSYQRRVLIGIISRSRYQSIIIQNIAWPWPFAAKLCGSQEQILKCSINRKRWQKSIRAQSSKHTTNQALQKPNKGLDWYHQQPQVPIREQKSTAQHSKVQHNKAQNNTAQYRRSQQYTAQHSKSQHSKALYRSA